MVLSAFALIPIDSTASEYQLSDLNFAARLALLRFVGFDFFSFCLSWSGVMGLTRTLVRTKPPFFCSAIGALLTNTVLPTNRIVRREIEGQPSKTPRGYCSMSAFGGKTGAAHCVRRGSY